MTGWSRKNILCTLGVEKVQFQISIARIVCTTNEIYFNLSSHSNTLYKQEQKVLQLLSILHKKTETARTFHVSLKEIAHIAILDAAHGPEVSQ